MKLEFTLRKSYFQVFSAICSNFSVAFILALFATKELLVLTVNIMAAIVSIVLAILSEEILENYD